MIEQAAGGDGASGGTAHARPHGAPLQPTPPTHIAARPRCAGRLRRAVAAATLAALIAGGADRAGAINFPMPPPGPPEGWFTGDWFPPSDGGGWAEYFGEMGLYESSPGWLPPTQALETPLTGPLAELLNGQAIITSGAPAGAVESVGGSVLAGIGILAVAVVIAVSVTVVIDCAGHADADGNWHCVWELFTQPGGGQLAAQTFGLVSSGPNVNQAVLTVGCFASDRDPATGSYNLGSIGARCVTASESYTTSWMGTFGPYTCGDVRRAWFPDAGAQTECGNKVAACVVGSLATCRPADPAPSPVPSAAGAPTLTL